MTLCRFLLPMLAAMALTGCVTTEQMPDGRTKVRFSDDTVSSLTSMMPSAMANGIAGSAGSELDLIATLPSSSGEYLYLGGRFDAECTAALFYSAKSGKPLATKIDDSCRIRYLARQQDLKAIGKPYDRAAPVGELDGPHHPYWDSLTRRVIGQLAAQKQFKTRVGVIPRYDKAGTPFVTLGFLGQGKSEDYALRATPAPAPVVFSDPADGVQMRATAVRRQTDLGESIKCEALLEPQAAVDLRRKPPSVNTSDFTRYVVPMKITSMSCTRLY
ncbi:hypothetical protein Q9323_02895 [Pseudomonas fulva]|uniref:hypothetical protein n=1 Tax=Pseudomonas fulva TaxID=47880 RepID=UPI000D9F8008|nr:hypothetical protein [Pseudomonas fulva]PYB88925.1 hypothetical protein DMX01_13450 [Pseudomonas fulva]PYC12972.1 hypothetical protein DMX00_13025 [Pseudomonas fulva]